MPRRLKINCSEQNNNCKRKVNLTPEEIKLFTSTGLTHGRFKIIFFCDYHKAIRNFIDTEVRNKIESLGLTSKLYKSNIDPYTFLMKHLKGEQSGLLYYSYINQLENKLKKFKETLKE
jgi:hypothetical protein